jgi:hypothetical protein
MTVMADETPQQTEQQLDQGTYDVIRNRLASHGQELRRRLDQLNEARKNSFGSIENRLVGTERITTSHNCIPRDLVAVGDKLFVGFNVHFGLKTEIDLADVLGLYRFENHALTELTLDDLRDPTFEKDFKDLYRFYKNTSFGRFFLAGPHLYMKFRVGRDITDFKAFKWLVQQERDHAARLKYLDNRSDHEVRYPPQHEFEWKRAGRDQQRHGKHPHVSIEDILFVEAVGGDLTIKIENNTDSGEGIYAEPVDNPDQTLDDAEVHYAILGPLVLLRIRPYQERDYRHFIYNTKLQTVVRMDALADAGILLPDEHGIIFPTGYCLATGVTQRFPIDHGHMVFERRIPSPNGEDFLYVFYNRHEGVYVLMAYNLIKQTIDTPVICNGYCLFPDGEMIVLKAHEEPQRHHGVQVWQTPFVGPDFVPQVVGDSYLQKIGNRDIVRGMAECSQLLAMLERDEPYASLYVDIVKAAGDVLDGYFWLDHDECFKLAGVLREIKSAAETAVGEFEKITRIRRNTADEVKRVSTAARDLINANATHIYDHINVFVEALAGLRQMRGEAIALRQLRYIEPALVDELEAQVAEQTQTLGRRAVEFLLQPGSMEPYDQTAVELAEKIPGLTRVADARELEQKIDHAAGDLEMLIDIVGNLHIDDAMQRTTIIDGISAIFTKLNAARSTLRNRRQELGRDEGIAEFNSQLKLLNQAVANYLDLCDTPEKADQHLTRMMVQIEELEGRFAEFDEFALQLSEKRQEVYNAFENRKLQLIERRNKRVQALATAADRILAGVKTRVEAMTQTTAINAYFAADLMIDKVRDIVAELGELGDSVKVDDIQGRLKTIRETAIRQLQDRQDLYENGGAGGSVIRFGRHRFSVNTQVVDLTTIVREGEMLLHLSGTRFFEPIDDAELNAARDVWDQEVVSENPDVYRGEYLAYLMFKSLDRDAVVAAVRWDADELLARVQQFMGPRYAEGYTKGVHDVDGAAILRALIELGASIDLLRYGTRARALAAVFWQVYDGVDRKALIASRLQGFGSVRRTFPTAAEQRACIDELRGLVRSFATERGLDASLADDAGEYLFHELIREQRAFVASPEATRLTESFLSHLKLTHALLRFEQSLQDVAADPLSSLAMARDWVAAYLAEQTDLPVDEYGEYLDEAAATLFVGERQPGRLIEASVRRELAGLVGSHPRIAGGKLVLHFNEFTRRLDRFRDTVVPRFEQFTARKKAILDQARHAMRLDEFKAKVLSSFVRNRLIDSVFLPLIGDNMAKQIGATGAGKRTDRSGLLLLISPPGYGKTTLMEYLADRLGMIFMKINGPAVGHAVTSLDPSEAPNAAAREELHKLNLALEMGDNVMLYLDDIQHCNTELLQKFISLCDAQRRIEGVYKGRTRTYDLRGRKFAVVMAGNPYTESGEKFRIPDMLANRADTYNLGDIIGEHGDAFKLSYLENAMTSNPTLNPMAGRSPKDIYGIERIASTGSREGVELEGNYTAEEVSEMVAVVEKLIKVRDIILKVNQQYIRSAGMEDQYRTEPSFLLQGSYRNMNRIAEKVVPVMNDRELETLILSSYEQDSQTLTTGAEANLLKFKEMMGWLTAAESERWNEIKRTFARNNQVRALGGEERTAAVIAQLTGFNQNLGDLRQTIESGIVSLRPTDKDNGHMAEEIRALTEQLKALAERAVQPAPVPPDAPPPAPRAAAEPQEIRVVNKVPATFLYVMKEQFELMKNWLEPLTRLTADQDSQLKIVQESLRKLASQYEQMVARLERSQVDGEAETDE